MRPLLHRQRGSALVITVGLLAVLAVIGFGFAVLARLHHDISGYYRSTAQTDLIAHAAIHYAIRDIRYGFAHAPDGAADDYRTFQTGAIGEAIDSPRDPWYVDPEIAAQGYEDEGGNLRFCNLHCNSYALVHDDLGSRIGLSLVKVLDCAGKLNINDNFQGTYQLVDYLQTLLEQIDATEDVAEGMSSAIISHRPTGGYTSLQQLRERDEDGEYVIDGMTERRFEILKHYLTIYSWPHRLPSVQGYKPYVIRPHRDGDLDTLQRDDSTAYPPTHVQSPININTAPEELLYTLFSGVTADSGTALTVPEIEHLVRWVLRKRDPENKDYWREETAGEATWDAWTGDTHYDSSLERKFPGYASYPVGPFSTWHGVADFLYSLTARADHGPDPFENSAGFTPQKAEAILAAICPNSFASIVPRNSWNLAYTRIKKDGDAEQISRDKDTGNDVDFEAIGKNQVDTDSRLYPMCFSSMGRFEIYSRTYTFIKADHGAVSAVNNNSDAVLTCKRTSKPEAAPQWSDSPPQWRGYSVLIYDGKGKGILRGIVSNSSETLTVAKLSTDLDTGTTSDTRSRYYIVGPRAFTERIEDPDAGPENGIAVDSGTPHVLTDAAANWEDDEWNGHRIVVYTATVDAGAGPNGEDVENVTEGSIQERIILDTDGDSHSLIVSPEFDIDLFDTSARFAYMILGCDGVVEHEAAVKAYDVIHHTTQYDFEHNKEDVTRIATGPNPCEATGATDANASEIDGWIACADVEEEATAGSPFLQNFEDHSLAADDGTALHSSQPSETEIKKDVFEGGRLLSDGILLRADTGDFVAYAPSSQLTSDDHHEGGFVSFWFRPSPEFFEGSSHVLARVFGSSETSGQEEDITIEAAGPASSRKIKLIARAKKTQDYDSISDTTTPPNTRAVKFRTGTREHTDTGYSDISDWQPGEWHHIAVAWYECVNDDEDHNNDAGYNGDANPATDWRDDEADPSEGTDGLLDTEVIGRLRVWVDGRSSDISSSNEVEAFNIAAPEASARGIGLGDSAAGTIDGVVAYQITGTAANDEELSITIEPAMARYDGFNPSNPTGTETATFTSKAISLTTSGDQDITLGTVAWTGLLPWCKQAERFDNSNEHNPIRVEVSLGTGNWSASVPYNGQDNEPVLGGGAALRTGHNTDPQKNDLISSSSTNTISYKVYLLPFHGEDAGSTTEPKSKLKGRQTPVLDDITITYLGPVIFFHWH